MTEIKYLTKNILSWLTAFLALALFFFSFGLKTVSVFGIDIQILVPTITDSLSVALFKHAQIALVPPGVTLAVLSPLTAFLSQIKVAFFLAFIAAFPFLLGSAAQYLRPALYPSERRALFKVLLFSSVLFAAGCIFAYIVIIPKTFAILYDSAASIGATLFFGVGDLVALTFGLSFVTGILFLLPVCMYGLARLGIVETDFWKTHWRYALFFFLVLSAIITPDGSGISMLLLSAPLLALYSIGIVISNNIEIRNKESGMRP